MRVYAYKVAGLGFSVAAPECFDVEALLPSFSAFREECGLDVWTDTPAIGGEAVCGLSEETEILFRLTLRPEPLAIPGDARIVERDENDMGYTRLGLTEDGRYCLELTYHNSSVDASRSGASLGDTGIFISDRSFSEIAAYVGPSAPDCGLILSSMLRIAFAQAVILRGGISVHASAVVADGRAFLFLGRSGTGKSTHARMWLRNIPGSHLLNDDNPAVRIVDGEVIASGTPWSGKTPCYRNESYPVGGIARLVQSDADIFTEKNEVEAFVSLLPSCSAVHGDAGLQSGLYDTVARIVELVPVGELECLPDNESALICYNNFKSLIK